MNSNFKKYVLLAVLGLCFILVSTQALAVPITVDNSDEDKCLEYGGTSCYCEITTALAAAGPGDILNIKEGTYTENITIDKTITIQGEEGNAVIIDGGAAGSVITTTGDDIDIVLKNLTIQNGSTTTEGGAINFQSSFDLIGSTLTIDKCLIQNNTAKNGGALYVKYATSPVTITNTTFTNNNATDGGAVIYNLGTVTFDHVTITENDSDSDDDESSAGGALSNPSGTLNVVNSIIANNNGLSTISTDCTGTITSTGYNIITETNGGCTITQTTGDIFGTMEEPVDALLSSLSDNGGDTLTYTLESGSPALDAIPEASCTQTEDQRGFVRPVNTSCDIGAVEVGSCGDGVIDYSETCDDGNTSNGDGCSSTCQIEECGNGTVDSGEECDDGNSVDTDSCTNECLDEDITDDSDDSTDDDIIDDSSEEETEESSDQEATPAQSDIDAVSSSGCALVSSGPAGFGGFAMMFFGLFGLVSLRFWAQGARRRA